MLKKEYHLYDFAVFIIITVFMISFFYTLLSEMKGAKGYMTCCISLIAIFALLY